VLAALGLVAITAARERGYWLRSRCGLIADGAQDLEIVYPDGKTSSLAMDKTSAIEIYRAAVAKAKKAGLPWSTKPVVLKPQRKLIDLVLKSREIRALEGA
jgi:CRISPR-associated protein Csb1